MSIMEGLLTYPNIVGFFRRKDGEEYVIWAAEGNVWHVTDGIIDTCEHRAVLDYERTLKRVKQIDETKMLQKLRRYLPDSPVIGLLQAK